VIAGGDNPTGRDADFNGDGNTDQGDVMALVEVLAGGACPWGEAAGPAQGQGV